MNFQEHRVYYAIVPRLGTSYDGPRVILVNHRGSYAIVPRRKGIGRPGPTVRISTAEIKPIHREPVHRSSPFDPKLTTQIQLTEVEKYAHDRQRTEQI
jgi:hypothetical protein